MGRGVHGDRTDPRAKCCLSYAIWDKNTHQARAAGTPASLRTVPQGRKSRITERLPAADPRAPPDLTHPSCTHEAKTQGLP